jgi:hypothetical protein
MFHIPLSGPPPLSAAISAPGAKTGRSFPVVLKGRRDPVAEVYQADGRVSRPHRQQQERPRIMRAPRTALRRLATAAALLIALGGTAATAATLDFDFSFTNTVDGRNDLVTGVIRGLTDNAESSARSVEILTNSGGFGIGEYIGAPSLNRFNIANGSILSASFKALGQDNTAPGVTDASLSFSIGAICTTRCRSYAEAGLTALAGTATALSTPITFTAALPAPTAVPLPAGVWLLSGAIAGLALFRRKAPGQPV